MRPMGWNWLWRRAQHRAEQEGQIAAIHKSQAVIEFDLLGHVLTANQNFLDAVGYTLPDIVGQHHRMFVAADTAASPAYGQFWQRLGQGIHDAGRYQRIAKDGRRIWLQASYNPIFDRHGRPFKVIKYATDITAQQQRNADAEGQLAAISKVQAIIEFDLDGHILWANGLFLQTLGYTLEEITGQHHRIFVQPAERDSPAYRHFWQRLAQGQHETGQYLRLGKQGQPVWIEASYNPILDADGHPFKVVKYATDISRRFRAVQTLRSAVEALGQSAERADTANRLAANACTVAEAGGQTMQTLMGSMAAINTSSQRIADIIGVMDGIAFQTNILALNAAVEAARAGEQGRGFAVVAGEVRTLAQHSAAAAKEVKQLIQHSASTVALGVSQVQQASTTMEQIVQSSQQATTIMAEAVGNATAQSHQLQALTEELSEARRPPPSAAPVQPARHAAPRQVRQLPQPIA